MHDLKVIFLGTSDFAVESLKILVENKINIVAVVTAPDKPKGRGRQIGQSTVKVYAESVLIPILQPSNLKKSEFLQELANYQADLQIVVAFRMLPVAVWDMPPLGTFNLHASLLPQYRGAAPINWAIINGEKETGVTTFFLKHKIDTGAIIYQEKEKIYEDDTVGDLYLRLMKKGANLVLKTVHAIASDIYPKMEQRELPNLRHAPKIFKEDCKINWNRTSTELHNFIRGMSPYPTAWTELKDKMFKIFSIKISSGSGVAGSYISNGKTYLKFITQDGAIDVLECQIEGKKRMKIEEFLRGFPL